MIKSREFLVLIIFSNIFLIFGQQEYCRICRDHTMCIYRNSNPVCSANQIGLNANQKTEVLNVHIFLRRLVAFGWERRGNPGPQPRARNMRDMVWDDELATIAQRWANQCSSLNDKCRNVQRFKVGQNVAILSITGTPPVNIITRLVILWYNEVTLFDSRQVERVTNFDRVGHYTQMLWATSVRLGCGFINHKQGENNTAILVCNYGPAGNIINGKMYDILR
ncbi:venom allergen 5-like [Leptopilina boulardi]|uniref:venom allergen 5-like n=1 Tax=Leptopilina boulardi TaxID=63433 RepID=UPI0021F63C92|nr:venom allergen 5-like [Leptopilina boulardi]